MNYPFLLKDSDIKDLIKITNNSNNGWERLCVHSNKSDNLQVMVMCMKALTKSGFHYNKNAESLTTYTYRFII